MDKVVFALRQSALENLNFPAVESCISIELAHAFVASFRVRQIDLGGGALEYRGGDGQVFHICNTLRREQYRGILLSQRLEPVLNLVSPDRMPKKQPRLVNRDKRGAPVQRPFHPSEEIEQNGHHCSVRERTAKQRLHLTDDEM